MGVLFERPVGHLDDENGRVRVLLREVVHRPDDDGHVRVRLGHQPESARHKYWPRISGPKRFKRAQVLRELESQILRGNFGIDCHAGNQIIFSQTRCRMVIQAPAKLIDAIAMN